MKIAIDNRAIAHSGIGVYSRILLKQLPKNGREVSVVAYGDDIAVNRNGFWNKYVNGIKRVLRDQITMSGWLQANNVDVYHNPRNTGTPLSCKSKIVTTIHDIIPHIYPQYYLNSPVERAYYELMLRLAIKRSDAIITISEFSKQELLRCYDVGKKPIYVIPQGCNEEYHQDDSAEKQIRDKYAIRRPYILTMGGSEYRKNVKTVLEAYCGKFDASYDLIVIGGAWRGRDLAKEYADNKEIKFLTGISDEDLLALYNGAAAFVFASFYEGFGIPLLEAMHCGTPVIAAKASCLPEIAGDGAEYFSALDVQDLRRALEHVLSNADYAAELVQRGFDRAKLYSWEKTVAMTYEVYKKVLG